MVVDTWGKGKTNGNLEYSSTTMRKYLVSPHYWLVEGLWNRLWSSQIAKWPWWGEPSQGGGTGVYIHNKQGIGLSCSLSPQGNKVSSWFAQNGLVWWPLDVKATRGACGVCGCSCTHDSGQCVRWDVISSRTVDKVKTIAREFKSPTQEFFIRYLSTVMLVRHIGQWFLIRF